MSGTTTTRHFNLYGNVSPAGGDLVPRDGPITSMTGVMGRVKLYFLSYDVGGRNKVYQLLPFVQDIASEKTCASVFEWTLGDKPIRWHNGRREERFVISGKGAPVYLNHAMPKVGAPAKLKSPKEDGLNQLESLIEYLADYEKLGQHRNVRMMLHMPFEGKNYYIEPTNFSWHRGLGAGTKFGYSYSLTLRAWKYDASPAQLTFTPEESKQTWLVAAQNLSVRAAELRVSVAGKVNQYARLAYGVVGLLPAFVEQASRITDLYGDSIEWSRRFPAAAFVAATRALAAYDDILDSTPVWMLSDDASTRKATDFFYDTYYGVVGDIYDSACFSIASGSLGKDGHKNIEKHSFDLKTSHKTVGGYAGGLPNDTSANYSCSDYVVKIGDSLEKIAIETLGNSSDWKLIALLNNIVDPGFYNKKPLTPGMVIKVPNFTFTFQDSTDSDPYFTDMFLDAEGDLVIKGEDNDDVKTVSHHLCLKQDLLHRLLTIQGQSLIFPDNGLPFGPGQAGSKESIALLVDEVKTQISTDPRIQSMAETTMVDAGSSVTIESSAYAVDGKVLSVVIPV